MRFWGIWPPSEWDKLSVDDQAIMIADYESEMTKEAWDSHLQARELEKAGNK